MFGWRHLIACACTHTYTPIQPPITSTGPLARGLVACTGAHFCGVGLVETKNRAIELVEQLEAAYDIPQTVRVHFSGCPNSCGQSQVADIGLMGAPAKKDGKAVEGVDVFLGGAVGEGGFRWGLNWTGLGWAGGRAGVQLICRAHFAFFFYPP